MIDAERELSEAVKHFWTTRASQSEKQGGKSGIKDAGNRTAVTGGKHADGFVKLVAKTVTDAELPDLNLLVHTTIKKERSLPGYFRPCKEWDVVVLSDKDLVAVVEVKSQVGSFGNNFNNRVEEAIGNATDFWTAYETGLLKPSARPWLGYIFMLEECPGSTAPTKPIHISPFAVDSALQRLSYVQRYEAAFLRLVRKSLYDAACFFTSNEKDGSIGKFVQPNSELSITNFVRSLHARAAAFAKVI